jgi:hypothetical protein
VFELITVIFIIVCFSAAPCTNATWNFQTSFRKETNEGYTKHLVLPVLHVNFSKACLLLLMLVSITITTTTTTTTTTIIIIIIIIIIIKVHKWKILCSIYFSS